MLSWPTFSREALGQCRCQLAFEAFKATNRVPSTGICPCFEDFVLLLSCHPVHKTVLSWPTFSRDALRRCQCQLAFEAFKATSGVPSTGICPCFEDFVLLLSCHPVHKTVLSWPTFSRDALRRCQCQLAFEAFKATSGVPSTGICPCFEDFVLLLSCHPVHKTVLSRPTFSREAL